MARVERPISVSNCDSIDRAVAGLESGYGRDEVTVNKLKETVGGLMSKVRKSPVARLLPLA